MKKFNKFLLGLIIVVGFVVPNVALAYEMEYNYSIPRSTTGYATPNYIIAHEAGNPNNVGPSSLDNEVSFMSRNYYNAFTNYFVGSGGRVYELYPAGKVSWGAGAYANWQSYAQVELSRTNNSATFAKDYVTYVTLLRDLSKKAGIPTTLDTSGRGIKTHKWVTYNLGGSDHTDPIGYLKSWGVSEAKFKQDIANGVDYQRPTPPPQTPQPLPNNPNAVSRISTGDTVNVTKSVDIYGTQLWVSNPYQVRELKGNRAVLTKNGSTYAALDVKNLAKVANNKPIPAPKPPVPIGWNAENATFTSNSLINVRTNSNTNSQSTGQLGYGDTIHYNAWKAEGSYIWVRYDSWNGVRYFAVRPVGGQAWGSFK